MKKNARELLVKRMTEAFENQFRGAYVLDSPEYADWVFVYPRNGGRYYLSQLICKEQEDAFFVSVGWNTEPVMDELASDTGARFEDEVGKTSAFLPLSELAPEVGQPVCLDDPLAAWYGAQRAWYEALERGAANVPLPPTPPPAAPVSKVLSKIDPTVDVLLKAHVKAFARFDAGIRK